MFALNARDRTNPEIPIYNFKLPTKSDTSVNRNSRPEQER